MSEVNSRRQKPRLLKSNLRKRQLAFESFEARRLLVAEGSLFSITNQNFDVSGLGGTLSGTFSWGNGKTSTATLGTPPSAGPLRFRFDYSLDAVGFFNAPERRDTLQRVGETLISKFSDSLLAISPGGSNQWSAQFRNPATGATTNVANLNVAANEIIVYAGARLLGSGILGLGNRGAFSASSNSQAFIDTVRGRGQLGALATPQTDIGAWGGAVAFDTAAKWHFGLTTAGLDSDEFDFASVAFHELMHVIGFGTTDSFDRFVSGNNFTGPNATAVAGVSPVPLNDPDHFALTLLSNGQTPVMVPFITSGIRRLPTRLDLAALQDVGWVLIQPTVQVSGSHTYGDNGGFQGSLTLRGSNYGERVYSIAAANVTNVAPTFVSTGNLTAIAGVPLTLSQLGQFNDPGFGESQAVPPRQETFTFSIDWGDGSTNDSGTVTSVSLGAAGRLTTGSFGGTHTYPQLGTYTIRLTVTDDDGGQATQQRTIVVGPPPSLVLSIDKSTFAENAGANAATLSVRRVGFDNSTALTINLTNSDTSELAIPTSVIILANNDTVAVPVNAVDDLLLDGTVIVSLQASTGSITSQLLRVNVTDVETISLSANRTTFGENEGAGVSVITVTRSNTDTSAALTVTLSSNDTSEVTIPLTVIIPVGSQSATVGVTAVDDNLFDGSQIVRITGSETRYQNGTVDLTVTDFQPTSLALQLNQLSEESVNRTTGRVSLRSPAPTGGVTLQLTSDLPNQLQLPASVFIPQGQTGVDFPIQLLDDFVPQGRRSTKIRASGPGVIESLVDLVLTDTDEPFWTNESNPLNVNNDDVVNSLDILAIVNTINRHGARVLNPNNPLDRSFLFVDVNRDGIMNSLDILTIVNFLNSRRR